MTNGTLPIHEDTKLTLGQNLIVYTLSDGGASLKTEALVYRHLFNFENIKYDLLEGLNSQPKA